MKLQSNYDLDVITRHEQQTVIIYPAFNSAIDPPIFPEDEDDVLEDDGLDGDEIDESFPTEEDLDDLDDIEDDGDDIGLNHDETDDLSLDDEEEEDYL